MAGCLTALRFWRKKDKSLAATTTNEKLGPALHPRAIHNSGLEKRAAHARRAPPSVGAAVHAHFNPAYTAHSAQADSKWDAATLANVPVISQDMAQLKNEGIDDPDEVARRKKAEQEEQERLDFFQML